MLHQTHRESIGKGKQCKFGEKITLSIFWEKAGIFSREKNNTDSLIGFAKTMELTSKNSWFCSPKCPKSSKIDHFTSLIFGKYCVLFFRFFLYNKNTGTHQSMSLNESPCTLSPRTTDFVCSIGGALAFF